MIAILQNAVGFLIQFLPCVFIIFLPFSKGAYRFSRKKIFVVMTIISVLFAGVFSAVLCLRDIEKYPLHITISNSFMLAAILFMLAAYIWLVKETVLKKLLVFFIAMFYGVTVYILVNVMYTIIFPNQIDTTIYPYTDRFIILYSAVTALLLPMLLLAVIRPLKEYIELIEPRNMKREFFIATFSTLLYFVITVYCETSAGNYGVFHFFLIPMIFLTIDQILIYWLIFRESVRRKLDSEQLRAIEIRQIQYENIVNDMENTRRMRHDMRHHYNSISDMLSRGKLDEMKDYLSKLIDTTVKRDNEVYCENLTVNGLLQYYIGMARDHNITCEVNAECKELKIEPADLTVLFGNTMENAINSCRKYTGKRHMLIRVGTVQGSFAIEISNSCKEVSLDKRYRSESGFLPAEAFISGREGGGYGLRSIAHTARKYGGSAMFRFDAEKELFTVRIRLNMHTNEEMTQQ